MALSHAWFERRYRSLGDNSLGYKMAAQAAIEQLCAVLPADEYDAWVDSLPDNNWRLTCESAERKLAELPSVLVENGS